MLMMNIRKFILIAVAGVLYAMLAQRLGRWPALGVWAAGTFLATALAAVLLRTTSVGQITWKNRLAGLLLPWGYAISSHRLAGIALISWIVWCLVALGVAMTYFRPVADTTTALSPGTSSNTFRTLLLISWAIDAGGILYLLGMLAKFHDMKSKVAQTQLKALALLTILILASVAMWMAGKAGLALLIAGGPPAVLGSVFALFMIVILVFGRKTNWH